MQDYSNQLNEAVNNFFEKYNKLNDNEAAMKLSDDKWSLKEIIGHLIDSASNNHQRFVRLQIETDLVFPNYHYSWIDTEKYNTMNYFDLISLWKYYNILLCNIIKNINEKSLNNVWNMDGGSIKLKDLIIDYLKHLKEHLKHFEERYNEIKANQ